MAFTRAKPMSLPVPEPQEICNAGLFAIRNTLTEIKWWLDRYPERALETTYAPPGRKNKEALRLDIDAEDTFVRNLNKEYEGGLFKDVLVYGEESIDETTDLSNESRVVALVDMVDGTDLVERNLSNWCSAAIFFCPSAEPGKRILASCVGLPSGRIYYAHANSEGVYCKPQGGLATPVGGPSQVEDLRQASISFYGQKVSRLQETMKTGLIDYLLKEPKSTEAENAIENNSQRRKNRIYTLAGIPMIVKLIDHRVKRAANIDVVFDCNGQRPHDFIAGAYLAKRASAVIKNIDSGNEISYHDLETALLRPDNPQSDFRYVVAATDRLCDEILPLLASKSKAPQSDNVPG
jgi:fructose-1,6-bisphosphatase/inositol monophosphatase family enzyme